MQTTPPVCPRCEEPLPECEGEELRHCYGIDVIGGGRMHLYVHLPRSGYCNKQWLFPERLPKTRRPGD